MNRIILCSFFIVAVLHGAFAQELQLSFGADLGVETLRTDSDYWYENGDPFGNMHTLVNEKTNAAYFTPGLSISLRYFLDTDSNASRGFFFHDRAVFATNGTRSREATYTNLYYASVNGSSSSEKTSKKYSIANDDEVITIMDFDMGLSYRLILSKSLQIYADLGLNFTVLEIENPVTDDLLNYLGAGIYLGGALQVNLTETMYLEFGLSSIFNALSSQKHTYKKNEYEDAGRWDSIAASTYMHIGWRLDVQKMRQY